MFIPKEVGQFFARATQSLDDVDLTLASVRAAAERVNVLTTQISDEVAEWRRLRTALTAALAAFGKPDA